MSSSDKCNCGHVKEDHFNSIYLDINNEYGPTNCSECSCPKFIEEAYEWDGKRTKH